MNNLVKSQQVTDVVSQEVEILEVNTDAKQFARLGWGIVLVGVVGFFLWATLAPLDRGVPMGGTVMVSGHRKVVQHQNGGTIDQILVKDGDVVKTGQVLFRMNDVQTKATAEMTRVQWIAAKAVESRLIAERDGAAVIHFPASLVSEKKNPTVAMALMAQEQLFTSRRGAMQSELAAIDENIAGIRSQLQGLEESMVFKKAQQKILKEQLDSMRDLAKEGYVARNRLLESERGFAQLNGSVAEDIGNMGRATRQISELTLRKSQRQQDTQKEIRGQLSEIQRDAEAMQNRLAALDYDLKNVEVKAPVDGVVIGLNVFTSGAVIPSGFKLLELVPAGEAFFVEGQLPVNLVDKVHAGLKVELIFSAFNTNTTPHIPAVVTQVSADRSVDERTGAPYYKVKAEVSAEGMKKIAHSKMQIRPGMPVELFVKTGERSMMSYLLKPILDRANSAMSED
ncbi:MAG: HlyD family type I secretion periplasmic adaptor subunit [Candidatus Aquirickettsiella gammari]